MSRPKKKMSLPYLPARLKDTGSEWYIVFHQTDPVSKKRERYRRTFDINRIPLKKDRRREARRMIQMINNALPKGYPFTDFVDEAYIEYPVMDLIREAVEFKRKTCAKNTGDMYSSMGNVFKEYLVFIQKPKFVAQDFNKKEAQQFLKWGIMHRGITNRTHNNYLIKMKSLFNVIVDSHDSIDVNPFVGIKYLKQAAANRRYFSDQEREIIVNAVKHDKKLLLAILLQFHCFIRPAELLRLRFRHFDMQNGMIRMPNKITKNKDSSTIAIPPDLLPFLIHMKFETTPKNWHIFGRDGQYGPRPAGDDQLSKRHRKVLQKLIKGNLIDDDSQMKFYSWKDTGAVSLIRKGVNIREIQLQLRHASLEDTQKYVESFGYNFKEIKSLSNKLIDFGWKELREIQTK